METLAVPFVSIRVNNGRERERFLKFPGGIWLDSEEKGDYSKIGLIGGRLWNFIWFPQKLKEIIFDEFPRVFSKTWFRSTTILP